MRTKFAFIAPHASEHAIRFMCRIIGLSRRSMSPCPIQSGWRTSPVSRRMRDGSKSRCQGPRTFPGQAEPPAPPPNHPIWSGYLGWLGGGAGWSRVNLTRKCSSHDGDRWLVDVRASEKHPLRRCADHGDPKPATAKRVDPSFGSRRAIRLRRRSKAPPAPRPEPHSSNTSRSSTIANGDTRASATGRQNKQGWTSPKKSLHRSTSPWSG